MKMLANFDERLDIEGDQRRKVRAAGPIHWDEIPPAIEHVRVKATITQGQAGGTETCGPYKRGDGRWWCDVKSDVPFHPAGDVPATGWLLMDGRDPWRWQDTPDLVDPGS
jgi:hypothetical protein